MTGAPRERLAATQWLRQTPQPWDLACRWHGSKSLRNAQGGWDATWLQQELRRHFNQVDRLVLKSGYRNRNERISKIIVLEHTEDSGWHAHGLIKSDIPYGSEKLQGLIDRLWNRQMRIGGAAADSADLFWAEASTPAYLGYIFKETWKFPHEIQRDNFHGFWDVELTYLGQ